ncbi:tetratricopeptide repeat protein [Candidatus Poribacteria bacterium]|nr:tetratricopeptide repeat protein [Candidatus Poribacteria bacterium]
MRNSFYPFISIVLILIACGGDPTIERGKAFLETGDPTAAIQQFEAALKQNPSNVEAYYQLGLAYEGLGDTTQAVNAFRGAAKLAPKRAEIPLALGRVYWYSGNRSLARAELQNLLSGSPKQEILLQIAGITGDAYHVQRIRTEGSDDYEQTFTEKGNMMTFTAKYTDDYSPAISPDGKWLAFASNRLQNAELYLMDIKTRTLQQLTHTDELDEYMPAFSPDGQSIAFVSERTRGGMMLPPVQASGSDPSTATIYLMDIDGRNQRPLIDIEGAQRAPVFSPDGQKIAFESKAPTQGTESGPGSTENNATLEIYVIHIDGTNKKQLTHNDVDDGHPTWAPNGKQIAFTGMVDDIYQLFSVKAGGGPVNQLTFESASHYHPTFSPNGKRIIYVSNAHNRYTLWTMNADGTNKTQLTNHIGAHFEPSLSKDGKTLVFSSDRSDHMRIYLMDLAKPVQTEELKARLADF